MKSPEYSEPGPKANLYPLPNGSLITCAVPIYSIEVILDGKIRAELEYRKESRKEIFLAHEEFYAKVKERHKSKPHVLSLRIVASNGEKTDIPDYIELTQQAPFHDYFMRHQDPIRGYLSARLGEDTGYKMSAIIPPDIKKIIVYAIPEDALYGIEFANEFGQSILFGTRNATPNEFELFNNERLLGFYTRTGCLVDSLQIITSMRRSNLYGDVQGGGTHDMMPPSGFELVGIHGYVETCVTSIGIIYAPFH